MAKKTRATSRVDALDPTTVVEPSVGDLPDAAANNATEPNMPEAAKETPGAATSDAVTLATPNEDVKPADNVQEKDVESESDTKDKVTATQDDDPDVPDLSLPHDTQELDDEVLEDAPRVEEVETENPLNEKSRAEDVTEDLKRPLEAIQPDEVTPAKKLMSEVNQDGSAKTIQCEE